MKANKFFAAALAALCLAGFSSCGDEPTPEELKLDKTSVVLQVEETAVITATVDATWESSDASVATVAGNGKTATVTAVKAGNAIIKATTADGQVKTCVAKVEEGNSGSNPTGGSLKGSQQWVIILDADAYAENEKSIVASFQPNDVDQFLYVWEDTYAGGEGDGINSLGNAGYTALVVNDKGWAGCGFCLTDSLEGAGAKAAKALCDDIVKHPDQYALHMAIKSTDNYSHCFYFMGSEATKFVLGTTGVYDGPVLKDFTRDGSWQEIDIEMSAYAEALASAPVEPGVNVFVALTEGVKGAKLNLDAVYFYKK